MGKMGEQEGQNEPVMVKVDLNYVWYVTSIPFRMRGKFWIKSNTANYASVITES